MIWLIYNMFCVVKHLRKHNHWLVAKHITKHQLNWYPICLPINLANSITTLSLYSDESLCLLNDQLNAFLIDHLIALSNLNKIYFWFNNLKHGLVVKLKGSKFLWVSFIMIIYIKIQSAIQSFNELLLLILVFRLIYKFPSKISIQLMMIPFLMIPKVKLYVFDEWKSDFFLKNVQVVDAIGAINSFDLIWISSFIYNEVSYNWITIEQQFEWTFAEHQCFTCKLFWL